jgi:protocatechuate 3,4-dioxygenase beta subunit
MDRALFGLLVVLIATVPSRGQAPARDTPTPAKGTASIRGRVVDATGKPLSRVEIRAGNGTGTQANGLTDGDGRYDLNELPAGTYTVNATKANYVRTAWGEARPEGPGKRITLADGQKLDNVNLSLKRGGVVTGKIVDEFGDPVTDVFVTAMRYQYIQGQRRLTQNGRGGATNDIGEYRLYGLSPGQYYISATLRNVGFNMGTDSGDRTGYAATFYPGTGNVAEAQRLTIAAGQTATGINLALLPIQTSKVSGTAVDAEGKPLGNAMIMVAQRLGATMMSNMGSAVRPDGKFTINNLTPGDYTLRVNGPTGESASIDVTVTGGDINDVQLVVAKPSTIRGRIVFADSATSAGPPKPTAIDLGAWRDWAIGQQVRSQAKIKDDGTFEISLQAGHVLIRGALSTPTPPVSPGVPAQAWRLNRVIANDLDVSDTGIDVPPAGTIDNVVVEMTNHSNEVSGRVTDADGNVVRDVFVIVYAQDPVHWTIQTRHLSVARPGLDDLFHVRLLAGDYYVVAMSDVETNAWTDPEFLTAARERATKFSIADGEKKTIDLPLTPAPVF